MCAAPASSGPSSSKSLMWMTAALFGGMAVLLGGGLFVAGRVVRSVGLGASAGPNTMKTPGGGFKLEREKEVGPGIPMYPHSALIVPGESDAMKAAQDANHNITRVIYHSGDPRTMVDQWYQDHLSNVFERHDTGQLPMPDVFRDARVSGDDITFLAEKNSHTRIIALTAEGEGTIITLIRIDTPTPEDASPSSQP
jgi:hypothetical protein